MLAWSNRIIFALSIVGLVISGYLLYTYVTDAPIVCANSGCETVRESAYSYFLGIPLPAFGGVMYATIILLSFGRTIFEGEARNISRSITLFSFVGVLISAYLTYLEIFVIKAICVWCVASAVVITAIFLVSLYELKVTKK